MAWARSQRVQMDSQAIAARSLRKPPRSGRYYKTMVGARFGWAKTTMYPKLICHQVPTKNNGHCFLLAPDDKSVSGTLWFLPIQNVLQPLSCSTCPIVAACAGIWLL